MKLVILDQTSRCPRVRSETRSESCLKRRARKPVSLPLAICFVGNSNNYTDVIVLKAMGEECAIDAKEAPKSG